MLTEVFGLTCPSVCSSQQSGDSSALCSSFLLLLPQKSPGPYPPISKSWIQPGVHPCPSRAGSRAELFGSQAGSPWLELRAQGQCPAGTDSPGGTGAAPLMGLAAPGHKELLRKVCPLCPCCARTGDSAVIPIVPGSIGSGCQGTWKESLPELPSACRFFPLLGTPMAGKGPDAPILCPKTLPMLVLVMSWHMPGAQLRWALPGTQDSSRGLSQGLSMAQILSLAWCREFSPEWRGLALLRQNGGER